MKKSALNKIVFTLVASTFAGGIATAQTTTTFETVETVETVETAEIVVAPDYSFDLDRTSDSSMEMLPADAGDYDVASPGEVQGNSNFTFDLE